MLVPKRHRGLTLVELMVGMVVSLVVLWGISAVYVNTYRNSRTTSSANQLNQELRAVVDIMVNDLRRSGYWEGASSGTNPFTATSTIPQISADKTCILYSYDAVFAGGTAGVVDSSVTFMDYFGFRLADGAVQTLLPTANLTSTDPTATCANNQIWENLTDQRSITVTALTFDTVGSKCIAYVAANYEPLVSTTFTTWTTTAGSTGPACSSAAPGAPSTYPSGSHTFAEKRQVNISITAQSKVDTTFTRSLIGSVLVRNNRVLMP